MKTQLLDRGTYVKLRGGWRWWQIVGYTNAGNYIIEHKEGGDTVQANAAMDDIIEHRLTLC